MEVNKVNNDNFSIVSELEQHINSLLAKHDSLLEENQSLKQQYENLSTEKSALLEKNRQVQSKIETILSRLKNLESVT